MESGRAKSSHFISWVFLVFFLFFGAFPAFQAFGAEEIDTFSATLTDFKGDVSLQKPGEEIWLPVEKDMPLEGSDRIKTGIDSSAEILIDDGSLLSVEENSEIELRELSADYKTKEIQVDIFLRFGRLLSNIAQFVGARSRFSIHTPTAVVGVRGTEFIVETTDEKGTDVGVFEGEVFVGGTDDQGNLIQGSGIPVSQGNQTIVLFRKRPRPPFALRGRMLLHKKRMAFHRKRALDRRRNLHFIRKRRLKIYKRIFNRWQGFRRKGRPIMIKRRRPLPPKRRPGAYPPPRRRPIQSPPRR